MKIGVLIAVLGAVALAQVDAAPMSCESLAQMKIANGQVLSAETVAAGAFERQPNLPAFCRVTLKLTPSADSDIRAEVWLPQTGWNHKFQA